MIPESRFSDDEVKKRIERFYSDEKGTIGEGRIG
jgi:hypothetical protein